MKSFIVAMMLVAGPAMAQYSNAEFSNSSTDDFDIQYFGWCENNNVMAETQTGEVYVRANCTEQGLVCKAAKTFKANTSIYYATCQAQ